MAPRQPPRISIVTPSFNQARFLERTIRSVIDQQYPNLEYIVIDGGSTDGSVEIIKKYERHIARWVSEPDRGQTNAVNKGFALATGEILGWQNSDDMYLPGSFEVAGEQLASSSGPGILFGNTTVIDEADRVIGEQRYVPLWRPGLVAEGMLLHNTAAFWRREVWEATGGLDESFHFAMDYDFFLRATERCRSRFVRRWLGAFRRHGETKTTKLGNTVGLAESRRAQLASLGWAGGHPALASAAIACLKYVSLAHRLGRYACQGDVSYLASGAGRRLFGRRRMVG